MKSRLASGQPYRLLIASSVSVLVHLTAQAQYSSFCPFLLDHAGMQPRCYGAATAARACGRLRGLCGGALGSTGWHARACRKRPIAALAHDGARSLLLGCPRHLASLPDTACLPSVCSFAERNLLGSRQTSPSPSVA